MSSTGNLHETALKNLARPEGNVTGVTNSFTSLGNRWLELLKDAVPTLARVGVIYNRPTPYLPEAEEAARAFAVQTTGFRLTTALRLCAPSMPLRLSRTVAL